MKIGPEKAGSAPGETETEMGRNENRENEREFLHLCVCVWVGCSIFFQFSTGGNSVLDGGINTAAFQTFISAGQRRQLPRPSPGVERKQLNKIVFSSVSTLSPLVS